MERVRKGEWWLKYVDEALERAKGKRTVDDLLKNTRDLSETETQRAAAEMYFQWLSCQAAVRPTSETNKLSEVNLIYVAPPTNSDEPPAEDDGRGMAALFPADSGDNLDAWLDWFKEKPNTMLVSCWACDRNDLKLATKLASRGFYWGFSANWMCFDANKAPDSTGYRIPENLKIIVLDQGEDESFWAKCEDGHPCYKSSAAKLRQMIDASKQSKGRLVLFAALLDDIPIASATLYFGEGEVAGIAGLYEVEVVRKYRALGIGKAISYATCYYSDKLGYRYTLGNASDEGVPMYFRIGFHSFGFGQIYFLAKENLLSGTSEAEKEFITAIGEENVGKLSQVLKSNPGKFTKTKLSNQLTAVQLAIQLQKPNIAKWLYSKGNCKLDIMSAWSLGWRDELSLLIKDNADLLTWKRGEHGLTPLHEAARDNIVQLAKIILHFNVDLEIVDDTFGGTALDWAQQCNSKEVVDLINSKIQAATKQNKNKKANKKKGGKRK